MSGSPTQVILTNAAGGTIGSADRARAHRAPGLLHLAFSVQLVDPDRGWLVQRRSERKAAFALNWANSCCSHVVAGEDPRISARRRVKEELGLVSQELRSAGRFTYRATDPVSGLVEHELDAVLVGMVDASRIAPDPEEISEVAFLPFDRAMDLVSGRSGAPWALRVLERANELVERSRHVGAD